MASDLINGKSRGIILYMNTCEAQDDFQASGPVILIPAYNPDATLPGFVRELSAAFREIVVVDDGSTEGCGYFLELEKIPRCKVLHHAVNRGKGAALKTGLGFIGEKDVITADADGQHTVQDIKKLAVRLRSHPDGLVLGVRSFKGNVPLRSRFGNFWTRIFFFLLTGIRIKDTQTGLRAIPAALVRRAMSIEGDRYEYEMAVLTDARNHPAKPSQVSIETIYRDNNAGSHFNPMKDTVRIYRALVRELFRRRPRVRDNTARNRD